MSSGGEKWETVPERLVLTAGAFEPNARRDISVGFQARKKRSGEEKWVPSPCEKALTRGYWKRNLSGSRPGPQGKKKRDYVGRKKRVSSARTYTLQTKKKERRVGLPLGQPRRKGEKQYVRLRKGLKSDPKKKNLGGLLGKEDAEKRCNDCGSGLLSSV